MEIKTKRARAGGWLIRNSFLFLSLFSLVPTDLGRAQTNPSAGSVPAELEMTPEQIELQKKLGAATAAAQKDPAVQVAYQKLAKYMRELDDLLYGKIKQIDPSLKDYVDKLMKAKYPDAGQGK